MTTKQRLNRLVDELSDADLRAALRVLEGLRATALPRSLTDAPEEDEEISAEEERLVQEAREELDRGESFSLDDVKAELAH